MPGGVVSNTERIRMNAFTAASESFQTTFGMELSAGSARRPRVRLNGHVLLFGVAAALALATASECQSITHLPSLMYGALLWIWWAVIANIMWKLSQRSPAVSSFAPRTIALHLLAGASLGYIHLFLLWAIGFTPAGWGSQSPETMWRYLMNINRFGIEILIYGFVFAITGIIQFQFRAQREAIRALELERQLSAAHLQALQMQLEPHFLFNTLNAITTLVELGRQQQAAEMLSHLNAILKSTLQRTAPEKVPLSQELEIVENYLAIEQVRFADRLRLELKVDPGALDGLIPCFLLQPIVENAIRHGIARCENEGLIEASARREGALLHLRIRDTGSAPSDKIQPGGHGIGLKNTRQRLAHFYPRDHAITAQPLDTGGFEVAITIPYERCQQ
jgi:sensor histidine kinase YesM